MENLKFLEGRGSLAFFGVLHYYIEKKQIISKEILHEDFYNFSPIRKTDYTINP